MQEFVWTVDDFCDRVTRRLWRKVHKYEEEHKGKFGYRPYIFLLSEHEALAYLVTRAEDKLKEAEVSLIKARRRLAKCRKVAASKPEVSG